MHFMKEERIMPNIASILKSEIQRLAKKEVKAATAPLHKTIITLRKELSALKKCQKANAMSAKVSTKSLNVASKESADEVKGPRVRPTGKTIATLRQKFGMTQSDFGKLLDVSNATILKWEKTEGALNMRTASRQAFITIQKLGAKAARAILAEQL
jgi:DNA-binding transcriptional regulator YiaG